uniref:Uncharacterized protein n=1 Tax=Alexandrium monilatum TaxID=311494 RepID=A0A7S4RL51_9DINO
MASSPSPGDVVVFEDRAQPGTRRLESVLAGPLGDGTYDLSVQRSVRPDCIRAIASGEAVEYYSTSLNGWIPAQVLRTGPGPGTLDLDCKDGVDLTRVRLPSTAPASGLAGGRPTQVPGQAPVPVQATPQRQGVAAGGLGPLCLQAQDHCFYLSMTHGWIPARVQGFHQDTGLYDLDVKPGVRKESVYPVRGGDIVEYFSTSANQWIRARVLQKRSTPGYFDLDCKDNVDLTRMRPPADAPSGVTPSLPSTAASSAASPGGARSPNSQGSANPELEAALELLRSATQKKDPQAVREALSAASRAGVPKEEMEPAERSLARLWAQKCRTDLQQAVQSENVSALQAALRHATEAGLPREDLEPAERAVEELEARQVKMRAAQRQLEEAMAGHDRKALQEALRVAGEAGLPEAELEAGRRLLLPVLAAEARAELRSAVRRQSPRGLREALQLADEAGLPKVELEPLRETLATLESQASQVRRARTQLEWAMQGKDAQVLQEALQAAANVGLPLLDLNQARQALDKLKWQESARKQLRQAMAVGGLAELQTAVRGATQAGVPHEELVAAEACIRSLEGDARQKRLTEQLERAVQTNDAAVLRQVLQVVTASGLSGAEVDRARAALQAWEHRAEALVELRCASMGRDPAALRAAIRAAAEAGVQDHELEDANQALQELEATHANSLHSFGRGSLASSASSPTSSGGGPGAPTQPQFHHGSQGGASVLGSQVPSPAAPTQPQMHHFPMPGAVASGPAPTQPQLQHPAAAASGPAPAQPQLQHRAAASSGPAPAPTQPQLPHRGTGSPGPAPTQPQLQHRAAAASGPAPTRPQLPVPGMGGRTSDISSYGASPPATQPNLQLEAALNELPPTDPQMHVVHGAAPDGRM